MSAPSKSIGYTANGNIQSKTGIGSYVYGSGITVNGAGPHAVKTAGGVIYSYDANGNMTSATNGRSVIYTAYNKPRTITSAMGSSTFYYGGERELVVQVESNGSASATRTYVGDVYEKSVLGATTEERFYVRSPAGLVAIRTVRTGQPTSLKYVHRDHLGSTDVLTDATGAVVQRMSFDAWGKRRDPSTWSDSALYAYAFEGGVGFSVTPQYTGHVGLGHLELVHMQGRVYDPVLGRFLSADPYVQDPASTQSFNRYAYVWNNPLSSTDPSGYLSLKSLGHAVLWSLGIPPRLWSKFTGWVRRLAKKQWLAPIVGAVLSFVPGAGPFLGALVAAGLQTAINGGSIGEILLAAGMAAATYVAVGGFPANGANGIWTDFASGNLGGVLSKAGEWVKSVVKPVNSPWQLAGAVAGANQGGAAGAQASQSGPQDQRYPTGWPTKYKEITDPFDPTGKLNPAREGQPHLGVDIKNPLGEPVFASDTGEVLDVYYNERGGNQIGIQDLDRGVEGYAHTRPAEGLSPGQKVRGGDVIGYSDASGRVRGPHLHYTYRPCASCARVDPLTHLPR